MSIYVLPDVESVIVAYLKAHADVTAVVGATAIATELPAKPPFPFLQVTLIGGSIPVERHLAGPTVQLDSWGGTRLEARTLAYTAHAALVEMVGVQGSLGTVTGVSTLLHPRRFSDPTNNRPRYQSEVRIWLHP